MKRDLDWGLDPWRDSASCLGPLGCCSIMVGAGHRSALSLNTIERAVCIPSEGFSRTTGEGGDAGYALDHCDPAHSSTGACKMGCREGWSEGVKRTVVDLLDTEAFP